MQRLLFLLTTGTTDMQEQALTCIATLADRTQQAFTPYYSIMDHLKKIIKHAEAAEFTMLRCKAVECASLIGKFLPMQCLR